jgi:selenocysteine-specific elongation factor
MDEPDGSGIAFVDVPGHERFVPNMLAGLGPVPAVLMVVAADGGWMPQSAEHLAAINALGISHGILAVTRADLADPGPVLRRAQAELAATSLGRVEAIAVSAVTGAGLPELRQALARLARALPVPGPAAPVRLWVDRAFSIRGSGTVVTGTLPAGTVCTGGELLLTPSLRPVRVRTIESRQRSADEVQGVARVALNLRGVPREIPARGMALIDPNRWTLTSTVDIRCELPGPGRPASAGGPAATASEARLPRDLTVHVGSARTPAHVRVLNPARPGRPANPDRPASPGNHTGPSNPADPKNTHAPEGTPRTVLARLTLRDPLPLHVGDRLLLRDPGAAGLFIVGATVLDVAPPPLTRRGAAAAAATELGSWPAIPGVADLLGRHGLLRQPALAAMGLTGGPKPVAEDWLADPAFWAAAREQLTKLVSDHATRNPLAVGLPVEAARAALHLPTRALVEALARPAAGQPPPVTLHDGYLTAARAPNEAGQPGPVRPAQVPERLLTAVRAVRSDLAGGPFRAPEAARLQELGLDIKSIAAAARAGLLLRISDQIVLAPGADTEAAQALAQLPQPFTTAQARQVLGTTRRVAIPLLEYLDRARITERLPDDRRRLR